MKFFLLFLLMSGDIYIRKKSVPILPLHNDTSQIHFLFHRVTYLVREERFSELGELFDEKFISQVELEKVVRKINLRKNDKTFQKYSKDEKVGWDFEARVKSLKITENSGDAEIEIIFYIPYQLNKGGKKIIKVSLIKTKEGWKIQDGGELLEFISNGWKIMDNKEEVRDE